MKGEDINPFVRLEDHQNEKLEEMYNYDAPGHGCYRTRKSEITADDTEELQVEGQK